MKLDFSKALIGIKGVPLKKAGSDEDVDLKHIAVEALLAQFQDEPNLPGEKKMKRYALAEKISVPGEVELEVEEVALLKDLIGKAFGPAVVGPAFKVIEGKA